MKRDYDKGIMKIKGFQNYWDDNSNLFGKGITQKAIYKLFVEKLNEDREKIKMDKWKFYRDEYLLNMYASKNKPKMTDMLKARKQKKDIYSMCYGLEKASRKLMNS